MSSIHIKSQNPLPRHLGKSQTALLQVPLAWELLSSPRQPRLGSHQTTLHAPEEAKYQKSMGIFQREDFQNHQRLELPFHNWASPPNSKEMISFFFPWLANWNIVCSQSKTCHEAYSQCAQPPNWKQPCLVFGLGYFHHWTVWAKAYMLPRKTFVWNPHLIQTELELTLGNSKDSSELWKTVCNVSAHR